MSGEREAFLQAILAEPDDDTPRLVFADWLDEYGTEEDKPHAALIRAQCRAERLPPNNKERRKLETEAKAILDECGERWSAPLRETGLVYSWEFRRGFLEHVTMSATTFARNAKKLFEAAPTIRSAYFEEASNKMRRVADCVYLARLTALDIRELCSCGYCPIHKDLRALFNSKHVAKLTTLNVAGDRMDAAGIKRLAKSAALARLTSLDVSDNPFRVAGITELAQSKRLRNLVTLNLSNTYLGGAGVEALAEVKNLPALRTLILQNNGVTVIALKKLVASPLFAQLTSLDLSGNPFGDTGAKVLAEAPTTAKLESLGVRGCKLNTQGKNRLKKRYGKGVKW